MGAPTTTHDHTGIIDVAGAAPVRRPGRWVASAIILVLLAQVAYFLVTNPNFQWDVVASWFTAETVMRGLLMTLELTVIAMVIGVVLGTLIAVGRMSQNPLLRTVTSAYVWLLRGIPELVQLLFWFNLAVLLPKLSIGLPFGPAFVSWQTNQVITPLMAAILGLGLLEAAYMAEIVRGGLLSVDHGQVEAAKALGMGGSRTLRRIVLPQAMRFIIPPTGSQIIRMVKGTSLVSVIALADLLYSVQVIYNRTFQTIPLLIVACGWYLIVTSILYVIQSFIERYYARGSAGGQQSSPMSSVRNLFRPRRQAGPAASAEGETT